MPNQDEFREIAHCGGKITFKIRTQSGQRRYSVNVQHSSPTPAGWFGVYALPQGIPVQGFSFGGIGEPFRPPPPTADCIMVFVASDREGMFGRYCQSCNGYWRSRYAPASWPARCPYCYRQGGVHSFMTKAQGRYVEHYTQTLIGAIFGDEEESEVEIDMDQYADLTNREVELPAFYHTEESQQSRWKCSRCDNENDILGHYGYCSSCGYRNNLNLLKRELGVLKDHSAASDPHETLKDVVSQFDGFCRNLVECLAAQVPMTLARQNVTQGLRCHNVRNFRNVLKNVFDIEIFQTMNDEQQQFAQIKFLRRHLYEHKAGVVDKEYLEASGDNVRIMQKLREQPGEVRRLVDIVERMATALDEGFHSILRPREIGPV